MPNLADIRKRIRSVKNTQQITRAMKMVAAAKLRRAQDAALRSRPYATKLEQMLSSIAARANVDAHPAFRANDSKRVLIVVVSSDRGLCGGFNTNLAKQVALYTTRRLNEGAEPTLFCVGKKGRDYFRRRSYGMHRERINIFSKLGYGHAKLLAEELMEWYQAGEFGQIVLAHNEFKSVLAPRIRIETLLPIPRPAASALTSPATPVPDIDYIYEPDPQSILAELVPWHVKTQVWRVLLESSAAEHAARMTAMESATKNAGEMIEQLTLNMNKVRQAAITKELIEVVSGALALKG